MRVPRPRVLHIVPALFGAEGVIGGAERYACELARHMAAVTPTTLLAFGDRDREYREGSLRVRTLGNPWLVRAQRGNPFSLQVLPELARADVVHCHQQHVLVSSAAALAGRLLRRRVFCSDLGGGGWDVSAYVSTDGWFHGHLHLSEYSRRTFGHDGRQNAWVIYGGVDSERFSPGTAPRGDQVVFVGRILPHKGLDDLVDAVRGRLPLVIAGPAPDPAYLRRLQARARGASVEFRHDCRDDQIVELYRRAACVVLPSVYRDRDGGETQVPELLGQTLLEAMACGAPVICTRVASLPELVEDGMTGLVVPPGQPDVLAAALQWVQANPRRAADLARAGRAHVRERFTWQAVVERCLAIYRRGPAPSAAAARPAA